MWLFAAGCALGHQPCDPGETLPCACATGALGTAVCSSGGTPGPCRCEGSGACTPGRALSCGCEAGSGARSCEEGVLGPCACGAVGEACVPGVELRCTCEGGLVGRTRCEGGVLGPCEACMPPAASCVPGRTESCACGDTESGRRTCSIEGNFGPCVCASDGGVDAPPIDSPVDASVPCDPYVEACSCEEATPPSTPPLAMPAVTTNLGGGLETLVGMLPVAAGIVLVFPGELRLVDRYEGTVVARWTTTRTVASATADGDRLIVGEGGSLTILDAATLTPISEFRVTEACAEAVVMPCNRLLCGSSRAVERVIYTYDLDDGAELARSEPETYTGIPMLRVPGLEAILTATAALSPNEVYFHRLVGDELTLITDSPYHGHFDFSEVLAFVGHPATHVINQRGDLFRVDGCMRAPPGAFEPTDCLTVDGTLGTVAPEEFYVAIDGTADTLAAIACRRPVSTPWGLEACHLDRIDLETRAVVHRQAIPVEAAPGIALRLDPWTGASLISTPVRCPTPYPDDCYGWEARLVPLD